ncbi:MAG: SMP-30/gluconolactonase/LRE family protein [Dehalococcoidia bacterium]|nr:SMP-30/gluconolactonase/LRE family protein [Dehalococcoidia bacterium]
MPIERVSPDLDRLLTIDQQIQELGDGFGGDGGPAEGPLWWSDGGYLLFSDIHNNRRMKWSPDEGVTLFQQPTNHANGLTRDLKGRLLACEHSARRVTRQDSDGEVTTIANRYRGSRLNRPNDVIVKSDGSIYFTDPGAPAPGLDLDYSGVYVVSPDLDEVTMLVGDFITPNGIAFSPDESILYVNDTRRQHIRAFDVQPNGTIALASDRVLCDLSGDRPGVPDGMKVDIEGNIYCGGSGGVWVIDANGNHLGTIVHGHDASTNVAFGGDDWKTLFFTTWNTIGSVQVNIQGIPVPTNVR